MASTIPSNSQDLVEPQLSATAVDGLPSRTPWNYVQDRDGRNMTEPVVGFYFNPPPGAKCLWSTDHGVHDAQHLQFGFKLPRRTLILWDDERLEAEAAFYRKKYWEDMKSLTAPQRFEDLYKYFDSSTMWLHGAINLWNLVNLLVVDAHTNWHEHEGRVAAECNTWVLDWLESFPTADYNRGRLINWNQKSDILTAVTTQYDWTNDLKDLDLVGQDILRECLLFHFERLTGKKPEVACFNHHASTDKAAPPPTPVPAPAQGPVVVSTDVSPKSLPNDQPILKPGSPPPQGLATIPEHASPTKTAGKSHGLTIDIIASTNIPKHTVSAPTTAVPHITVPPQISDEAEGVLDQNDGNDSTNDEFFNPQALAERVEIKERQLSAQSAPEESEAMLSARINNSQPRTLSQHNVAGHPTIVTSATMMDRKTNKPPSREARNSPPRGARGRRQGATNIPTYHPSQQAMAQQGPPMGPPPQHQHMMPPFDPHNGMQQQTAGFFPPTPPHGMPQHPNAFTSQGPSPSSVGMPPRGPHGIPFQHQFHMPLPRMDMPPSNSPHGYPMNAPPQYMAQQNFGPPVYQPNGYVPHPQHQPGVFNDNRKNNPDRHRDSMTSNGSRKVRDDPLHGPVFAMNPRKYSNAFSAPRKASNTNPEPMPECPKSPCINAKTFDYEMTSARLFDECTCSRCVEASRAVFVKHGLQNLDTDKIKAILMRFFKPWGPTGVKFKSQNNAALVLFNTDHDAVSAVQSLWSASRKPTIPEFSENTFIWYPLFSKHYTPKSQNYTGAPRGLVEAHNTSRRVSSSSTQRRGSNPYLGQRPVFNNADPTSGTPELLQFPREQQQMAVQPNFSKNMQPVAMHAVPYQPLPPQTSQRTLWVPSTDNDRRKSRTTESTKEEKALSSKNFPRRPVEELLRKEDWRSKPPSEEAIGDASDEVAVGDTASNASSQGARSIKVCLPNETGSARSRSASPEVEERPTQGQSGEVSPKVETRLQEEPEKDDAPITVEKKDTEEDDKKNSSDSDETVFKIAVPVEELKPIIAPEEAQATKKDDQKADYSNGYSKVTFELTGATETIDMNTVIRHKPQTTRALPTEWDKEPAGSGSDLRSRFADLQNAVQDDHQDEPAPAVPVEDTEGTTTVPDVPQAKRPKKAAKNKKQAQATSDASGSSSQIPPDSHSRGPSRASTGRPDSRASTKRPQSAASTAAESTSRPSSAMQGRRDDQASAVDGGSQPKKKKSKPQKKRKQTIATESSVGSGEQAKTGGPQDQSQGRAISGQEPHKKKPKIVHPKPGPAEKPSAPEPTTKATADDPRKKIDEHQAVSKDAGYRVSAGGSLRMKKNRSPTKAQQKNDQKEHKKEPTEHECKSLQTIFEPPSEENQKCVSPDAHIFPYQKFAIDQAKSMAPPKMSPGDKEDTKRKEDTANATTSRARIGSLPPGFNPYPQLPPNTKPSAWSAVVKRSFSNDPFSSDKKDEDQSKNWMKDKAVRSPQKPRRSGDGPADTSPTPSPTPSPEKKAHHGSGKSKSKSKSQLNAAAKAFTPSSSPAPSIASLRTVTIAQANVTVTTVGSAGAASVSGFRASGHQNRRGGGGGGMMAHASTTTQPTAAQEPAAPVLGGDKPIAHRAKRPSLPGQKSATDTRFVTPAEQTLDPASVEQPGPPTKEKRRATGPAQQEPSALRDEEVFPTLAAVAPRKQPASFAQAAAASTAPPAPSPEKENVRPASPAAAAASPKSVRPGRRGAGSGPGAPAGKDGLERAGVDDWTTVGPGKKIGGKNPGTGRAVRGGIAGGRGGRATQQGDGGRGHGGIGRVPVGEERKGG